MEEHQQPLVYTPEEARRLLKLGRSSIYEGIRRGEIPHLKVGRRILIYSSRRNV